MVIKIVFIEQIFFEVNYDPNMFVTRCIRLTQLLEPHQKLICIPQENPPSPYCSKTNPVEEI